MNETTLSFLSGVVASIDPLSVCGSHVTCHSVSSAFEFSDYRFTRATNMGESSARKSIVSITSSYSVYGISFCGTSELTEYWGFGAFEVLVPNEFNVFLSNVAGSPRLDKLFFWTVCFSGIEASWLSASTTRRADVALIFYRFVLFEMNVGVIGWFAKSFLSVFTKEEYSKLSL